MLIRTLATNATPTPKLLEACATFGLALHHTTANPNAARPTRDHAALELHTRAKVGTVTLLQGPSGSGKSTLLEALGGISRRAGHCVIEAQPLHDPFSTAALVDLIEQPLIDTLRTLASAGLADATLLARTTRQLSEGERTRLSLAQALAHAHAVGADTPVTLLVDEFASVLDRTSARCLCHALRRWLRRAPAPRLRIVLATAHDDVRRWLCPDLIGTLGPAGTLCIEEAGL